MHIIHSYNLLSMSLILVDHNDANTSNIKSYAEKFFEDCVVGHGIIIRNCLYKNNDFIVVRISHVVKMGRRNLCDEVIAQCYDALNLAGNHVIKTIKDVKLDTKLYTIKATIFKVIFVTKHVAQYE